MMDMADIDNLTEGQDRGAELMIEHPVTGERMADMVFIVAGPDSDTQRRARLMLSDAMMAYATRPSAEEYDRLEIERLARCVIGWRVKRDGVEEPFTFTNVVRALTRFVFVREQVEKFSKDRSPYFMRLPFEETT